MKLRWLIALFLAPALVLGAAPANAASTNIRTTKEYQALKSYVQQLNQKKSQPQTQAQIAQYRRELKQRRAKASSKVRAIYQDSMAQARQKREVRKQKVQQLKVKKRQTLSDLRRAETGRLNAIAANRRAELARINTNYDNQANKLIKERNRLQKKIAKATNPVKKANLQEELRAVQAQINTVSQERNDDIRIANNKYDTQVQTTKASYDRQIEQATEQADANIEARQQELRDAYAQSKQNAQARRANQFADVRNLYDRGVGYINQMQPPNPNPTPTPTPTPTPVS